MPETQDYGDYRHLGFHRFDNVVLPANSVGDNQFDADDPLSTTNQRHQHRGRLTQAHGTAATDERRVVHVARAAGTVTGVQAGAVVAATGDSTVTVDVLKNGTTVLTGVITLDSGDAAYAEVSGTVVTTGAEDYAAGDVFEVVINATVGTGVLSQGVYADVVFDEGPA